MGEDPDRAAALRGAGAAGARARHLPSLREASRVRHCALRTEQADVGWVRRCVHFHGLRHPSELGGSEDEVVSAKASRRLPVVLTLREVRELLLCHQGGTTVPLRGAGWCLSARTSKAQRWRGSSASRRPSPSRLKPSTSRKIDSPGQIAIQGALST